MYYSAEKRVGCFTLEPVVDLNNQTMEVSKESGARVSMQIGSLDKIRCRQFEDAKTVYEGFRRGAKVSNNGDCLGWRTDKEGYRWIKYDEAIRRSECLARGFLSKGLAAGQQTLVGIYAQNCPEWIITEQACYVYNMVLVPLYDTLGPDACGFIINQGEIKLVVVDKNTKVETLMTKREQCPSMTTVVMIETPKETVVQKAASMGLTVVQFSQLEQEGAGLIDSSPPPSPPTPDDLCTISYTSGTTGMPKGAMLTHGNVVADCTTLSVFKYAVVDSSDTMASFLPLAHMFERVMQVAMYMSGGRVGFFRGDIKLLSEDLQEMKPTVMPVVPRLLNRIYDRVMQEVRQSAIGFLKMGILQMAIWAKTKQLQQSIVRNDSIWDQLVFKRVRERLGGRVRLMITGSAPVSGETLTFIRCALGCVVVEGYGQTECVAACSCTLEGDHTPEHVGAPVPCCQIKLVDVPDMNYFASEGIGEVCVKGPNVFKGYYKDPEKTADALDEEGWLHTGDVGRWTKTGTLKLVDRKKHIFKLSQGEYIAPEKLENVFVRSRFVGQIFVHGYSLKSSLVAIVSPDPDTLPQIAEKELGLKGTMVELCKNEKVKKAIMDDLVKEGKMAGLQSFELVKDIYLHPQPFSIEGGQLTPTLKSKRQALKEMFQEQIEEMYRKLD